jgi:hypothetical protein
MKTAGITARIPYHFAHPSQPVASNAAVYEQAVGWGASTGGGLGVLDRRALDMEVHEGQSPGQVVQWALAWEAQTRNLGGGRPLFYTFLSYLQWLGGAATPLVSVFDLWIADYAPRPPRSVNPWPNWVLWQYTSSGAIPGIHGQCDLSQVGPNFFQARPVAPHAGLSAPVVGGDVVSTGSGYRLIASDGGVFAFQAPFDGSAGATKLRSPVAGMASTPDGSGYWLVAQDGGVFAFGAPFLGSAANVTLAKPAVGMARTPSGQGYWIVCADGGVMAYGDAQFKGSLGTVNLSQPVVGMAATKSGQGYWIAAADGGVFALGDAGFFGSVTSKLNKPIVGVTPTPTGQGYWIAAADGGVFPFGDAGFHGSAGSMPLAAPVVGISSTLSGQGYYLWAADGGVFTYGDAPFLGAM